MGLHFAELREAAPIGFVTPDFERWIVHRIVAASDRGTVAIPYAAMNDDTVADLDIGNILANRVNDSRCVAAADVKIAVVVVRFLACRDYVNRRSQRCPDVVVVDSGGHHINEDFVGLQFGHVNLLDLEGLPRMPKTIGPDKLAVHVFGHVPDRGHFADFVDFLLAHNLFQLPPASNRLAQRYSRVDHR